GRGSRWAGPCRAPRCARASTSRARCGRVCPISRRRAREEPDGEDAEGRQEKRSEEVGRGGRRRPAGTSLRDEGDDLVGKSRKRGEAAEDAGDREELDLRRRALEGEKRGGGADQ